MSATAKPETLAATDAARLIASRELGVVELVRACLQQIERREPDIRAWAHLDPERALAEARKKNSETPSGPLHGVPFGVKDIIDTHDLPTEYGSPIFRGHVAQQDAKCVDLLRRAGGIVLGKTVTTEFANRFPGPTRNPHNPSHTPGGSSSGSAAAIAADMVPFALGTQTTGSVIRPASYCGVVGYKPSFDTFDLAGVLPLSESLDTLGLMSRSIADLELVGAVLSHRLAARYDWPSARKPRIGICRSPVWGDVDATAVAAVSEATERFRRIGVEIVEPAELPPAFSGLLTAQRVIMEYKSARALADTQKKAPDKLSAELSELIGRGLAIRTATYDACKVEAASCRAQFNDCFGDLDLRLTPSTTGEAPVGLALTGSAICNAIWTLLHAPCVTLPLYTSPRGLPVGVQLVGRIGDDSRLLAAAKWLSSRIAD